MKLTSSLLANGQIIKNPVGKEKGYWVGAPGVFHAADEKAWYLTYRIRRPRGVEPDRGGEARIARSTDLKNWEDIWSVTKDKYNAASIERSALRKTPDGIWRYFTSYVDPTDGLWCVAMIKANDVRALDASKVQNIFKAAALGLEGIKDPWLFEFQGKFHMLVSVAIPTPKTSDQSHSSLDIFNTGECVSATAIASSADLDKWEYDKVIFAPDKVGQASRLTGQARRLPYIGAWDTYCRRINSIVKIGEKHFAFYDGSASHLENYEEKTGIAVADPCWKTITPGGPALTSPHASGSLRYIDAQVVGDEIYIFYEFAREGGAHDLRLVKMDARTIEL